MKSKIKLINPFTYDYKKQPKQKGGKGEKITQGESYTIQELFKKFAQGIHPNIERTGYYADNADFDSLDLEKVRDSDFFEKDVLAQKTANDLADKIKSGKDKIEKQGKGNDEGSGKDEKKDTDPKESGKEQVEGSGNKINPKTE